MSLGPGGTTQGWRRRRPHRFSVPYLAAHYRPGPHGISRCGVDGTRTTDLPDRCYKGGISSHQQVEPHLCQTMHRYTLIGRRMHLPMFVDRPRGRRLTSSFPRALPRPSHGDRGPRGGTGDTPSTTTNTPVLAGGGAFPCCTGPASIETGASAPRLWRDLGILKVGWSARWAQRTSRRGFGPARCSS
jgi:hypothetical protein